MEFHTLNQTNVTPLSEPHSSQHRPSDVSSDDHRRISADSQSTTTASDITLVDSSATSGDLSKSIHRRAESLSHITSEPTGSPQIAQPHPAVDRPISQAESIVGGEPPRADSGQNLRAGAEDAATTSSPDRQGDDNRSFSLLHRIATAISLGVAGSSQEANDEETTSSRVGPLKKDKDGTLILSLPASPILLSVLVLHYVGVVAYSITSLIYQIMSNSPSSAEQDMDKMQKFFGSLAHSDADRIVDAIKYQKLEDERKWNAIHDVIRACVHGNLQNTTTTECEHALSTFEVKSNISSLPFHSSSSQLARRKLAEISQTLRQSELLDGTKKTPSDEINVVLLLLIAIGVLITAIFAGRLAFGIWHRIWTKAAQRLPLFLRSHRQYKKKVDDEKALLTPDAEDETQPIHISGAEAFHADGLSRRKAAFVVNNPVDIWTAAATGDLEHLRLFRNTSQTFDVNMSNRKYGSLLSAAARSNSTQVVMQVLRWGANPNAVGGEFYCPLQTAAHSGDLNVVSLLLSRGASDQFPGGYYGTALNAAAEKGSTIMLKYLLEHTSKPVMALKIPGGRNYWALIAAAARGQEDSVRELIAHGADVDGADETATTALHLACLGDHTSIVDVLLQNNASKDKVSSIHGSPLHAACQVKATSIGLTLVQSNADVNSVDHLKRLPLHIAAENNLVELVKAILERDDSHINAQDVNGNTALHHAAIKGSIGVTTLLLDHNIDVSLGDKFEAQALFRAAGCQHPEIVKLLLEKGKADPRAVDCFKQTALHGPSETEDVTVQELLLTAGADVNARGARKTTPLHEACNMGRFNNVKLLLDAPDIDVNAVDDGFTTPICRALCSTDSRYQDQCMNEQIVLYMLEIRDDIDLNLCNGLALHEAARKGMLDVVRLMLEKSNTNVRTKGGKYGSALQAAAMSGSVEVMELLLERRADVNQEGGEYGTPLAAAAAFGQVAAVKLLLESGADPNLKSIGRFGSAYASAGRALGNDNLGIYQKEDIVRNVQQLIKDVDVDAATPLTKEQTPHLRDRWHLLPTGWTWHPEGVM